MRGAWPSSGPTRTSSRCAHRYHALEPIVQAGRALPYREVQRRTLRALAAVEDLPLAPGHELLLAEALPGWPAFVDVPPALTTLRARGWRLAILSNTDPDLLAASVEHIGVPIDAAHHRRRGRLVQARARSLASLLRPHWRVAARGTYTSPPAPSTTSRPAASLGIPVVWINREAETSDLPRAAELPDLTDLPATARAARPRELSGWTNSARCARCGSARGPTGSRPRPRRPRRDP